MCSRQNRQTDQRHVFLKCDGDNVFDALTDTGVDNLESGIAKGACDDLGSTVVAVETWLGDEYTGRVALSRKGISH